METSQDDLNCDLLETGFANTSLWGRFKHYPEGLEKDGIQPFQECVQETFSKFM